MEQLFFDKFLAKSDGTTLAQHTSHVITAGTNLLNRLPLTNEEREYWRPKLIICIVLHDLGKIHPYFQKRLAGNRNLSIRHELVSLWFCENFLDLSDDILFAISTHHRGVVPHLDESKRLEIVDMKAGMSNLYENAGDLLNAQTIKRWISQFESNLSVKENLEINPQISSTQIKKLTQKYQSQVIPLNRDRENLSFMRALLIASDHIGSARLEDNIPCYKRVQIEDFKPKDKNGQFLDFRGFQEHLQSIKEDVVLHAPTGSGKTEAAMNWVYANQKENTHLFYLLPYTASINAMVTRLQNIFGEDKVTALHSKTLDFFYEQLAEEASNENKDYLKLQREAHTKRLLSGEIYFPVKVATLHQILKTSLKGKGWELALFDYKNALFIIDEFHTYDALLTGLMIASVKLFKQLFDARFFFMSATIPEFMLKKILKEVFNGDESKLIRPNPQQPTDAIVLDRKRHQLFCQYDKSVSEAMFQINQLLSEGKNVLIIVNNVKTCQQIYKDIAFNGSVKLLHSGFHRRSRIEIEKEITHKDISKRPQLLIATQAVEVSLDIDYDVAFIENAPIDALIQRFGRVNRAGKLKNSKGQMQLAPIYLFEKILGRTPFYDKEVLASTWENLSTLNEQPLSENDLTEVCNKVYKNGYNDEQEKDFQKGLNNPTINEFENNWIAGHWENWIEDTIDSDNKKVEILCGNLIDEYDSLLKEGRYIEASQLLVQVYYYQLQRTAFSRDTKRNVIVAYDFEYNNLTGYLVKNENLYEMI
jgi:CRISPR-associated endonuclease/helicase Cas3